MFELEFDVDIGFGGRMFVHFYTASDFLEKYEEGNLLLMDAKIFNVTYGGEELKIKTTEDLYNYFCRVL